MNEKCGWEDTSARAAGSPSSEHFLGLDFSLLILIAEILKHREAGISAVAVASGCGTVERFRWVDCERWENAV